MNETIGVKGGANDRRRSLIINRRQKKKLKDYQHEQQLKKLEKRVKHKQIVTFLKVIPIVVPGQIFKTIIDNTKRPNINKEEVFSNLNVKVYTADVSNEEKRELSNTLPNYIYTDKEEKAFSERTIEERISLEYKIINKKVEVKEVAQEEIPILQIDEDQVRQDREELLKIKNRKIIDSYQERLKEARKDLRNAYFNYKVVFQDEEDERVSVKVGSVVDKLDLVIDKVEKLKEKIKIEHDDLYDSKDISNIIEEYIEDFKNNRDVKELKETDLYLMIEDKLKEINTQTDKIDNKTSVKKEQLVLENIDLESLKEKYYDYDKFNKRLLEFQQEQDKLLREVQEKLKKAVSVTEKVEIEVQAMDYQSKQLLKLLGLQMLLPGLRPAKALSTAAFTYLYFINNIVKPKTITRKYKVINVKDYTKDIEKSISATSEIALSLDKTKRQLNRTISELKNKYGDYLDLPECHSLLENLNKIRNNLDEKEYEIESIRTEQKRNLDKNKKILTLKTQ